LSRRTLLISTLLHGTTTITERRQSPVTGEYEATTIQTTPSHAKNWVGHISLVVVLYYDQQVTSHHCCSI